jgi:hypothetical protein
MLYSVAEYCAVQLDELGVRLKFWAAPPLTAIDIDWVEAEMYLAAR